MIQYWNKASDSLMASRGLLLAFGPLCLIFSSVTVLIRVAPFYGLLLMLALFASFVIYAAPKKPAFWTITGVSAFCFYCYLAQIKVSPLQDFAWTLTIVASLLISFLSSHLIKETLGKDIGAKEEAIKETLLWKNRFEILQEKIEAEKAMIAQEKEKLKVAALEESESIKAMRKLAQVATKESQKMALQYLELEKENRRLQENTPSEEASKLKSECNRLQMLLDDAVDKIKEKEDAAEVRRERNKKLLATSSKQAISLSDIAKNVKGKSK